MKPVVLFVDDDSQILDGVRRALHRAPFTVLVAASAAEAMRALASTNVHVVVSDDRMPGVSGNELLRAVRQQYPAIVRIALTGGADLARSKQLIEDGAVYRFLTKPVDRAELIATLERAATLTDRVRRTNAP